MSFTVAIIGRPNVGKSSLFNRMFQSRKSIIDDKNQTAEEIGNISDTISYEILTVLSSRMKRIIIEY